MFIWTSGREQAARLLAEGQDIAGDPLTDEQIAHAVGVGKDTLHYWKSVPVFKERVAFHMQEIATKLANRGVRYRVRRMQYYDDLAMRIYETVKARARAYADDPEVPGGGFGLQVKQTKSSGRFTITEYQYDSAIVKDLLSVLKQSAIEQGDWEEKPAQKPPEQAQASLLSDPRQVLLEEVLLIRARLKDNGVHVLGEDENTQVIDLAPHTNGINGSHDDTQPTAE